MLAKKWLTIDMVTAFVNDRTACLFCEERDVVTLTKFGVAFPVQRSMVYRWMIRAGASLEEAGQCFYTDRHNDPDVTKYRNEVYAPKMEALGASHPLSP